LLSYSYRAIIYLVANIGLDANATASFLIVSVWASTI